MKPGQMQGRITDVIPPCAQAPRAQMEVPVHWQITPYGHKKYAFHHLLPSNETKESFVLLITYWSSSKQSSHSSISLLPNDKRVSTCSETQNWLMFSEAQRGEQKKFLWEDLANVQSKMMPFFKLRGRVGAEKELRVLVATTALQLCSHPGRHESWVKEWANSLMSNITRARMGISSWKYTNTCVSFSKKFFLLFLNVHYIM